MWLINNNALNCYNCGEKFSLLKKSLLCSTNNYKICCKKCGQRNKLPSWASLIYLINAIIFIIPLLIFKPAVWLMIVFVLIYGLITNLIILLCVPLCK